jgi:hypothetical protein
MGKEQLDRTKRFTDDGKLSGIISSAKFVPRGDGTEGVGVMGDGLGQLFQVKGRKDEDLERELDVGDDVKVVKRRRTDEGVKFTQIAEPEVRGSPIPSTTPATTIRTPPLRTQPSRTPSKKRKHSHIITLKIPKVDISITTPAAKKRCRVQFAD